MVELAGDLADGDADERLDQRGAVRAEPAEAVAGEQILPGVVELPLVDAEHGAGGEGRGQFAALLHAGQEAADQVAGFPLLARRGERVEILRSLDGLHHHVEMAAR